MPLAERSIRDRLRSYQPKEAPRTESTRLAGVAAVLRYTDGRVEILLIKRAQHPGDPWSGHMAFPGGRQDETDADLLATAVRETAEEVGLDLSRGELLGRLDDLQAIARARSIDMVIVPHVFIVEGRESLVPEPGEVDRIVWAPLAPMFHDTIRTTVELVHDGKKLELPGWEVGGDVVWGLTHRMIESLFRVLRSKQ